MGEPIERRQSPQPCITPCPATKEFISELRGESKEREARAEGRHNVMVAETKAAKAASDAAFCRGEGVFKDLFDRQRHQDLKIQQLDDDHRKDAAEIKADHSELKADVGAVKRWIAGCMAIISFAAWAAVEWYKK